ncbi:ABC-F family ATP-binding cassette domain-containing protein [Inquilinus sp.]|jgi:ATPase subunit of ABC transporter with duplicated ATPase domains|uniref:ABC-F family ATP-binding cassette domain-containing protein n=1 Tax=Inquilinus sp. TaxID=1932117 RepID=UPI00378432D2
MPLLAAESLSHHTPDHRPLFEDLTLAFGAERTGLVGRNGVGKSTLLRLLLGEIPPQSGRILRQGRIGLLPQAVRVVPGMTAADAIGIAPALARLDRLLAGAGDEADLAAADWTVEERAAAALPKLGLPGDLDLRRPLGTLSGGEATRLALAGLLVDPPDMLVLDEPTNNLDADGRDAVCALLESWRGGALVVSHDRGVLRRMDRIVELSSLGARVYGGNWDDYRARRDADAEAAQRDLSHAEQEMGRLARERQAALERKARSDSRGRKSRAGGGQAKILLDFKKEKAGQSQGRQTGLRDRREEGAEAALAGARAAVERTETLAASLPSTGLAAGATVLAFEHVSWAPPGAARPVLRDLSFALTGPERVAVTGPNGAGKSTLLRLAVGELEPDGGRIRRFGVVAMLDQRAGGLRPDRTILENFRAMHPDATDNACRAALARFLFRADAALRHAGDLSGGETLRAALACVLGGPRPPRLLILDEPTNHLDLDSIAAIERAVAGYDGALLVASHDPDFLAAVGIARVIALPKHK